MTINDQQRLLITEAVAALKTALVGAKAPRIFAGADGFVDEIIKVVDKRHSVDEYTPIRTISDYAARLAKAAGKSTNIEFVVERVKMGGNGPLMCEAMGRLGAEVRYVGAVGWPLVDPLFRELEKYGPITPIAPAAITLATEFEDGKIMNGKHESLRQITWPAIVERVGGLPILDNLLREASVVALVNWTMLPFLTDVFRGMRERVVALGEQAPKLYFFDLCDPEKRTRAHLREALEAIAAFDGDGRVAILGMNEKESAEVATALDLPRTEGDEAGLLTRAKAIRETLNLSEVVIHPTHLAVVSTRDEAGTTPGPVCEKPKLTTGAGDHFNGGYMYARALGVSPRHAIVIGKCVSGFYVREGRGPSAQEVSLMAQRWLANTLDPWEAGAR